MKNRAISTVITMFLLFLTHARVDLVNKHGIRMTPKDMFSLRDQFVRLGRSESNGN